MKLCSRPSGSTLWETSPSASKPAWSRSISGFAQVNTAWNMTNSSASRMARPATGCSTTLSIRAVSVSGRSGSPTADAMMRSAVRWAARRSAVLAGAEARLSELVHAAHELAGAVALDRDRRHDRHAELAREAREIDLDAAPLREIEHVEHQHHRAPGALELEHEAERKPQVGGVGDAEQEVGHALAAEAAEHEVAGDLLVRAAAAQRVGAGQVDQVDAAAGRGEQQAGLALDGDARI